MTSSDSTWYRLYKSGWIEQGGTTVAIQIATEETITFIKEMANTNYNITKTMMRVNTDDSQFEPVINENSKTTMSFNLINYRYSGSGTDTFSTTWSISGQAKIIPSSKVLPNNLIKYN